MRRLYRCLVAASGNSGIMPKAIKFIVREIREVIPAAIYFLLLFHTVSLTLHLVLTHFSVTLTHTSTATILALVVAKVILIADNLPMMERFRDKPLIYPALWRTFVYSFLVAIAQYLEELIPAWIHSGQLMAANAKVISEFTWTRFLAVHIWLLLGLFVYCAATEVIRYVGADKFKSAFFGKKTVA
jgi:hypothetical protein